MSELLFAALSSIIRHGLGLHGEADLEFLSQHKSAIVDFVEKAADSTSLLLYSAAEENDAQPKVFIADTALPQQSGQIRSMYIIKLKTELPPVADETAALATISECFDWGILPGHSLVMLERLLRDVIIPLVRMFLNRFRSLVLTILSLSLSFVDSSLRLSRLLLILASLH